MKLTGAFFCAAAFLFSALIYLENEKRKMAACGGLSDALGRMKTELSAKLLPLFELTAQAGENSSGCVRHFFETVLAGFDEIGEKEFSAIWNEEAKECFPFFTPEQLGKLCRLGTVLGQSAGETQANCLEAASAFFRSEEKKIKEKLPETGRLAIGLSACAGLLTVIVLC